MRKSIFLLIAAFSLPLSCFAEDTIKIGAVFSLSSWGAKGGQDDLNGLLLARDDINAAGGIAGKKVDLIIEDDHSDLKATASAISKVADIDKVVAIVGPNWSEFYEVAAPVAERAKVPFISPSGFRRGVATGKQYTFTLWYDPSITVAPLAEYLKQKGYKNPAAVVSENAYFEGLHEGLSEDLNKAGIQFSEVARFENGTQDFRSTVTKLKHSKADAVVVFLLENGSLGNFIRQAKAIQLNLPLFASNAVAFDEFLHKTPADGEGLVYFDYIVPGGEEFRARYRKQYGIEPGMASAKAYDALYLIKHAAEKCGTTRDAIQECLRKEAYTGLSGKIAFDADGQIIPSGADSFLMQIKDGKFQKLTP